MEFSLMVSVDHSYLGLKSNRKKNSRADFAVFFKNPFYPISWKVIFCLLALIDEGEN